MKWRDKVDFIESQQHNRSRTDTKLAQGQQALSEPTAVRKSLPNSVESELGLEEELGFQQEERRGETTSRVGGANKAGRARRCPPLDNIKELQVY